MQVVAGCLGCFEVLRHYLFWGDSRCTEAQDVVVVSWCFENLGP